MKVLMIADFALTRNGGIETHIQSLSHALTRGYSVEVIFFAGEELPGLFFLGKNVRYARNLKAKLAEIAPDVVHIHGFASLFVIQSLKLCLDNGYKVVYTPHYHPFSSLKRPLVGKTFFNIFQRGLIGRSDALIALTPSEAAFFSKIKSEREVHVIPNGASIETGGKPRGERERAIIFVGRNDHNKRLDFLLTQERFFSESHINVHVITNELKLNAGPFLFYKDLTRVELTALYRRVSGIVIPSKYEAFSLVALEALSNKTWVLASDRVQIKDYFSGSTFYKSFEYNNEVDFQSKLTDMLSVTCWDENSLNFALSGFTWEKISALVLDVYYAVLSE